MGFEEESVTCSLLSSYHAELTPQERCGDPKRQKTKRKILKRSK
jgi:hypothetical protein